MLEIQKFLRDGHTVQELKDSLFLKTNETEDLILFTYDQIDSPKTHPIVMEARGVVLEKNTWNLVFLPFRRFFNYGECGEETTGFNFKNAVCLEKVDGSLCGVWSYKGKWHMSTRGTIDGTGQVGFTDMTFNELFDETVNEHYPNFYRFLDPFCTYMFELVSLENRIVTMYKERALYLLGMRVKSMDNEEEIPYEVNYNVLEKVSARLGVSIPKKYDYTNVDEMKSEFETMDSFDEGFVCVNYAPNQTNFSRVKVKNPKYLAIAHLKDSVASSKRGLLALVINNDYEKLTENFPEYIKHVDELKLKWNLYVQNLNDAWDKIKDIVFETQKDFALEATKYSCSSVLFELNKKREWTVQDWINSQKKKYGEKNFSKKALEWIKVKDIEANE